jgi:hypothetical protein
MKTKMYSECPDYMKRNVMLLLFREFFRRNRWSIPISILLLLFSLVSIMYSKMMFAFMLPSVPPESGLGVYRIYQTLPISNKSLTHFVWLRDVVFFPVLYFICVSVLLLVVHIIFPGWHIPTGCNTVQDAFYAAVWISGFYSISVYLGVGKYWNILYIALFILFLLDAFGFMDNNIISNLLLTSCPILIMLSYRFRCRLLSTNVSWGTRQKKTQTAPSYPKSRRIFWIQFYVKQVLILIVIQTVMSMLVVYGVAEVEEYLFALALVPTFVLPISSVVWINEIRQLRALPMTTERLTLYLLSIPMLNSICIAAMIFGMTIIMDMPEAFIWLLATVSFGFGMSIILWNAIPWFGLTRIIWFFPLFIIALFFSYSLLFSVFIIGLAMIPVLIYQIKIYSEIYNLRISSSHGKYISGWR